MGLNANHGALSFNQTFGYDPLNRLQTASDTGGWSRTFDYDRYGNLSTDPVYTGPAPGAPAAYNSANQVIGGSYDAAGNQILLGASAVTYDAENRQTSVTDPPGIMAGTETYWYDGLGQRVKKSGPSTATVYVYDALGQLAAEYSTASATAPCLTCYLSVDHLGSTRLVTDASHQVIGRHDFFPFGEEVGANAAGRNGTWGPTTDNVYQRFTGQERDQETGLDFLQARYYASGPGRFLSPDPANAGANPSDPQSWNGYGYVSNSPLVFMDPTGREVTCGSNPYTCVDNVPPFAPGYPGCVAYGTEGCIPPPVTIGGGPPGGGAGTGAGGGSGGGGGGPASTPSLPAKKAAGSCTSNAGGTIWTGTVTKPLTEVGAYIGTLFGPEAMLPGAAVGSMFGAGVTASFVPSTRSLYFGFTLQAGLAINGGSGGSINVVNVPAGQNPNAIANGLTFSTTYQPTLYTGATTIKSPGSGGPVVGPSVGTKVKVSVGASYNICLVNCGCGG